MFLLDLREFRFELGLELQEFGCVGMVVRWLLLNEGLPLERIKKRKSE